MKKIIAISGGKGTGKDTIADYICNKYCCRKYAFADPLKELAEKIFKFSKELLWGPSENRDVSIAQFNGLTPRKVLETFGDAGRACYPNIWAELTIQNISQYTVGHFNGVVISDLRMRNELDIVKKHGGIVIRIKRENKKNTSTHNSETEQKTIPDSDFDYVIDNNKDIKHLHDQIDSIMKNIIIL